MINGFYSIYFSGVIGEGFGIVVLRDGVIVGVDAVGAKYDGQYYVTDNGIAGEIVLMAPPGSQLVTGAVSGAAGAMYTIPIALPLDFANGQTLNMTTPTGQINIIFKKIKDI